MINFWERIEASIDQFIINMSEPRDVPFGLPMIVFINIINDLTWLLLLYIKYNTYPLIKISSSLVSIIFTGKTKVTRS